MIDQDLHDDVEESGAHEDPWIDQVYDDSWRIVATFKRGDDADHPHERFVYHIRLQRAPATPMTSYLRDPHDRVTWEMTQWPELMDANFADLIGPSRPAFEQKHYLYHYCPGLKAWS